MIGPRSLRRAGVGILPFLVAGLLAGCGGGDTSGIAKVEPTGAKRRKDMEDFMKTDKAKADAADKSGGRP